MALPLSRLRSQKASRGSSSRVTSWTRAPPGQLWIVSSNSPCRLRSATSMRRSRTSRPRRHTEEGQLLPCNNFTSIWRNVATICSQLEFQLRPRCVLGSRSNPARNLVQLDPVRSKPSRWRLGRFHRRIRAEPRPCPGCVILHGKHC